jgi:peptidoglycan hydrolase CwlO-like protein
MGWVEVFGTITITSVSSFLTYLLGRKRAASEVDGLILQNLEKSIQIYQTILDDMEGQIKTLNSKIDELESKIDALVKENHELKMIMYKHDADTKSKI